MDLHGVFVVRAEPWGLIRPTWRCAGEKIAAVREPPGGTAFRESWNSFPTYEWSGIPDFEGREQGARNALRIEVTQKRLPVQSQTVNLRALFKT